METMHAAGRRRLPPVPRPAGGPASAGRLIEHPAEAPAGAAACADEDSADVTEVIDTREIAAEIARADLEGEAPDPAATETRTAVAPATGQAPATDQAPAADTAPATTSPPAPEPADGETEQLQLADIVAAVAAADAADAAGAAFPDAPVADPADAAPEPAVPEGQADDAVADSRDIPDSEGIPDDLPVVSVVAPAPRTPSEPPGSGVVQPGGEQDPDQQFVARLRSAAADFAGAAGAQTAMVREAVPPARHRRARCRLVLRYLDGGVADVTLLGPASAPGRPSRDGFDRQILRWLGGGLAQDDAWLVEDPDAPDGIAVDLSAWAAAS